MNVLSIIRTLHGCQNVINYLANCFFIQHNHQNQTPLSTAYLLTSWENDLGMGNEAIVCEFLLICAIIVLRVYCARLYEALLQHGNTMPLLPSDFRNYFLFGTAGYNGTTKFITITNSKCAKWNHQKNPDALIYRRQEDGASSLQFL